MSKITSLIGTTWRLDANNMYGIPAGLGFFNIDGSCAVYNGENIALGPSNIASLALGYYSSGMVNGADLVATSDSIAFGDFIRDGNDNPIGDTLLYFALGADPSPDAYIILSFDGGTDISNPLFIDFINTYGTLVSGGEPPTAEGVKSKLQSLITASNAKTGKSDANLTDAVKTLLEGYKQGEDSPLPIEISTADEMTALLSTAEVGAIYKYTGETGTFDNGALYVVGAGAIGNKSLRELIVGSAIIGTLPAIGTSLEDCTWEEISAISAAGKGAEYFKVGDTKSVYIKGTVGTLALDTTLYVYILGFDHNTAITGDTGITFGTFKTADGVDVALCDSKYKALGSTGTRYFNMNHWNTGFGKNYGGWSASDLRYDILGSTDVEPSGYGSAKTTSSVGYDASATCATNPVANTLMSALPTDLRAVMKPMTIYTDNKGNKSNIQTNVTASVDYLPLLTEFEVFGSREWANQYERNKQSQYAYFSAGNSKMKYNHSSTDTAVKWWGRSPRYDTDTGFCDVFSYNGDGSKNATDAYYSNGLAPIFLV